MALPTRGTATSSTGTGATMTPTNTGSSGDWLVAVLLWGTSTRTMSTPATGWTELGLSDGGSRNYGVYVKQHSGSESDPDFVLDSTSPHIAYMIPYTGAAEPVLIANGSGSGTSQTIPAITTTVDDTAILRAFYGTNGGTPSLSWDDDTEIDEDSISGNVGGIAENSQATAGSTGTAAISPSKWCMGITLTIGIPPGAGGGGLLVPPEIILPVSSQFGSSSRQES